MPLPAAGGRASELTRSASDCIDETNLEVGAGDMSCRGRPARRVVDGTRVSREVEFVLLKARTSVSKLSLGNPSIIGSVDAAAEGFLGDADDVAVRFSGGVWNSVGVDLHGDRDFVLWKIFHLRKVAGEPAAVSVGPAELCLTKLDAEAVAIAGASARGNAIEHHGQHGAGEGLAFIQVL